MNWRKIAAIVAGVALIALVVFKLKNNKEIAVNKVYQYESEKPIRIDADKLQYGYINGDLGFTGTFEPYKESKISAEQSGKINRILVDVGTAVKKGQTLVQLDNSLLNLQLQSIMVQIEGVEKDVNRYTVLSQADAIQGVQLEKAELGLKSAQVQKATLTEQISKTTVKAPFDGIITAKLNEEGAFAAPGIPLLQITDISQLKFTINVSENDLKHFNPKQSYAITSDAFPDVSLEGKELMVGSKANMGSSFPIQFLVRNTPDLRIKSGMFGKAILNLEQNKKGILIPGTAIIGSSSQPQVYLVKDGKAMLQNITISERIGNKALVSSGLNEGDVLVTSGFINLFDGANVSIKK
ncbi:hypothetical protein P872_12885 [Rhodonellum psychrophilum GCM71 = DSM 17998]|uniref:YknX-like C-terminal permuted SH3-like domain-containing protein n=2 Tax=Rhodonellum TaxID=336827 RepID=U5BVB1_9BACT|nr:MULTISPECIES: efflux RND transporter periplasmic adaptor subunit [Rhodonellum]ERM80536.1 hypothetical protein P872_12885 [Rhodonellum psychrophilum GCM71 = DSM 17998]SDZ31540.1 RND family efflux transporter, MFP subunit [Rhodonellum ikkaensis]